jgi:hypothetical protein
VSLVFLRSHPDLLQRIDEADAGRRVVPPALTPGEGATGQVIAALRRRLEGQKQQLAAKDAVIREQQREIERLYGKLASSAR